MNHVEFKYYPFMVSLNKGTGKCNVLSPKECVPKETKNIIVKTLNMITNKDEAKAMTKHISSDCKCKFNGTTCDSDQKQNNKTCYFECIISAKQIIVGIPVYVFLRIVGI